MIYINIDHNMICMSRSNQEVKNEMHTELLSRSH